MSLFNKTMGGEELKALKELFAEGNLWLGEISEPEKISSVFAKRKPLVAAFGIPEIDSVFSQNSLKGGLPFGALHEWSLESELLNNATPKCNSPLFIISTLLGNALTAEKELRDEENVRNSFNPSSFNPSSFGPGLIAWIGKQCWPNPYLLQKTIPQTDDIGWNDRSLFIDPPNATQRWWAITQMLRASCVFAVVADASGLTLAMSRRLQIAAQKGGSLAFLIRPPKELAKTSASQTKWHIEHAPSETDFPQWKLELVRARSVAVPKSWIIQSNIENGQLDALESRATRSERETTADSLSENGKAKLFLSR